MPFRTGNRVVAYLIERLVYCSLSSTKILTLSSGRSLRIVIQDRPFAPWRCEVRADRWAAVSADASSCARRGVLRPFFGGTPVGARRWEPRFTSPSQ